MKSELLIQKFIEETQTSIIQIEKLKFFDLQTLIWKENEFSWSILECIEHLNLYGDYYLPKIESQIKCSTQNPETEFKSGMLGAYFAKSMLPNGKLNKIKTFKNKNPNNLLLNKNVIEKFINQQIKLLDLLNQSKSVNLNKVKIKTSITSLLKLNLGDTFGFIINHTIRHLMQIENIEKKSYN